MGFAIVGVTAVFIVALLLHGGLFAEPWTFLQVLMLFAAAILAGIMFSDEMRLRFLRRELDRYWESWKKRAWIAENFHMHISFIISGENLDVHDGAAARRFSERLVECFGLGPYTMTNLYRVKHGHHHALEREMYEGTVALILYGYLIATDHGIEWSVDVQEKVISIFPMPDYFFPDAPQKCSGKLSLEST
jgi:hypothetical protein